MPTPRPNENEGQFMARCVPQVIREGYQSNQAVAICRSYYNQRRTNERNYSGHTIDIKTIEKNVQTRITSDR